MKKLVTTVDAISKWTGLVVRWLCVALVLVLCWEVLMRYAFNAPTIWAHETSVMLGMAIVGLGWSFVHLRHGHVRVDVFYARHSDRGKALTDVICAAVFLFPLLGVLIYGAGKYAWEAYVFGEVLIESYWYPPALPLRLVVLLGLLLFLLQGVSQFVRDMHLLARGAAID